jgi:hypothetical protein
MLFSESRRVPLLCLLLLFLAGCASVHYTPGRLESSDKRLVFGSIVLIRDGEETTLNPYGTQISLGRLESTAEPLMILESFSRDGRFRWLLPPGDYVLTMGLNPPTGDIVTCAFTVHEAFRASYFGEMRLEGKKYFNTLSSANIRDVQVRVEDRFDEAATKLLAMEPGLASRDVSVSLAEDISTPERRSKFFRMRLDAAPEAQGSFRDIPFIQLYLDKAFSGKVTGESGAFTFNEGKSYFMALRLPDDARSVAITSHPFLSGVMDRLRIFAPAALLLDEEFSPVAYMESVLAPIPATLLPPRPARLAGIIDLTAVHGASRYLILFTTDDLLRGARYGSRPGFVSIPGGAMLTGLSVPVGLDAWITGEITVNVTGP